MKALEKDRNRRYETANGLAADVQRHLCGEPVLAVPPSAGYRLRKFVRRNKGPALAAAAVLVGFLGVATQWWRAESHLMEVRAQRAKVVASSDRAIRAEADTRAFSEFLVGDVLAAARPKGEEGGLGKDVTVKAALDATLPKLAERFRGRPRAEAIARDALGNTYRMIGDYAQAEVQLRHAIELRRQALGPDHEDTLRSQHNLANLLLFDYVPDKAESLLEETVRLREAKLGPDHRDTLASLSLLGYAFARTECLPESIRILEQTLKMQRARFGPDDPDSQRTINPHLPGRCGDPAAPLRPCRSLRRTSDTGSRLGPQTTPTESTPFTTSAGHIRRPAARRTRYPCWSRR